MARPENPAVRANWYPVPTHGGTTPEFAGKVCVHPAGRARWCRWDFPREFSRWFIPGGALIECYRHSVALVVWKLGPAPRHRLHRRTQTLPYQFSAFVISSKKQGSHLVSRVL